MRKQLLALAALTTVLVAAVPGPDPVITLDGVSKAANLTAELRAAIAPAVKALNAKLEKIVAIQTAVAKASQEQIAELHNQATKIHEECEKLHEEIHKLLTPEQRAALHEYLHGRMKEAGIQMPHGQHDGKPHGRKHGDALAA